MMIIKVRIAVITKPYSNEPLLLHIHSTDLYILNQELKSLSKKKKDILKKNKKQQRTYNTFLVNSLRMATWCPEHVGVGT
jgi:hypothetical protein